MLTSIYLPTLLVKILPFIVFISSMWFMMKVRNNKDLLTLKVFGYSNIKIFFILAFTSFFLGWLIIIVINPITSSMSKYYELTKSNYSKDIDHLVSFNNNGLWIKEKNQSYQRIITALKPEDFNVFDLKIFHFDENSNLVEKIISKKANIKNKKWELSGVEIYKVEDGIFEKESIESLSLNSVYDFNKINSLFKNVDTLSFIDLSFNYNKLVENGYTKSFLNQSLHSMLSLPFFLFLMTALASIFTMTSLKKSDNLKLIILGFILCILTFYLKDLSLALGQADQIPMTLAVWAPVIALTFFTFIGVFQINEN